MIAERDYADVVESVHELGGSHVVVVTDGHASAEIAQSAPAAVVVVTGDAETCGAVLHDTLFPRGRVIGAAGDGVGPVVDAVVLDRGAALECLACVREAGYFVPTLARIGARGITELL
ncbi:MAG: hypothetical protein WD844_02420 [Thermoleophilaceae bacterium]